MRFRRACPRGERQRANRRLHGRREAAGQRRIASENRRGFVKSSMPTQARTAGSRQFFGRGGTLSQWHPSYEFRPGQVEMAEAVESAIADKRHLIVEAGTGTGKTLAYLIPALQSGKRIVVSTGTKNLQE